MTIRSVALGMFAALGLAASAQAATVTFDFSAASSGGWVDALTYTNGGVTLTVTGGDTTGGKGKVATWAGWGLGMKSASDCTFRGWCLGTDHQIDSYGLNDLVTFTFSKAVQVTSLMFNLVDKGDTFDFYANGTQVSHSAVSPIVSLASAFGTSFGVGAGETLTQQCSGWGWFCKCKPVILTSAFKLTGMTVTVPDEPAPVPLPAAGLLLMGAVGGLAAIRRRRRG